MRKRSKSSGGLGAAIAAILVASVPPDGVAQGIPEPLVTPPPGETCYVEQDTRALAREALRRQAAGDVRPLAIDQSRLPEECRRASDFETEGPSSLTDAVWQAVIAPLADETRNINAQLRVYSRAHPSGRDKLLKEKLGEWAVIERRIAAAAGLTQSDIDKLAQYAVDAFVAERQNLTSIRQELICERQNLFETQGEFGRMVDETEVLAAADRDEVVAGLFEVVGVAAAERLIQFALSAAPTTRDHSSERAMAAMKPADFQNAKSFACIDVAMGGPITDYSREEIIRLRELE